MKKFNKVLIAAALFILAVAGRAEAGDAQGTLDIRLIPGPNYIQHYKLMGIWEIEKTPSMAVWLESPGGINEAVIFVTYRFATQDWIGEIFGEIHRPECLPIWREAHQVRGVQPESLCLACHGIQDEGLDLKDIPEVDAVSGATPPDGLSLKWTLPAGLNPGPYVVRVEINHSWDYNDVYADDLDESDDNFNSQGGQPSVLWEGIIELGSRPAECAMKVVGRGEPNGRDGLVNKDIENLGSALKIAGSITATFTPAVRP